MCLYPDIESTYKLIQRIKKAGGSLWLYKVYAYNASVDCIDPVFYHHNGPIKAGWVHSNRPLIDGKVEKAYPGETRFMPIGVVERGIHVITNRDYARAYCSDIRSQFPEMIVRVRVHVKDLVAAGYDKTAVFQKVWLPKEELEKALKAGRRKYKCFLA